MDLISSLCLNYYSRNPITLLGIRLSFSASPSRTRLDLSMVHLRNPLEFCSVLGTSATTLSRPGSLMLSRRRSPRALTSPTVPVICGSISNKDTNARIAQEFSSCGENSRIWHKNNFLWPLTLPSWKLYGTNSFHIVRPVLVGSVHVAESKIWYSISKQSTWWHF